MNHPFVVGNKRVALLATVVFLRFIVKEVIVAKADVPAIAKGLEEWMVVSE
jgi:prophage maintenance system killer protein